MDQVQKQTAVSWLGNFSTRELLILVALMIPTMTVLIDFGMVGVALPTIQTEFDVSVDLLSWVTAIGFLLPVPFMPIYGRLGDIFGKKPLFIIGMTTFVIGAIFGFAAPSFGWLIWGRLLQGFGSNLSLPLAMALIVEAFPQERHGRALGFWNASAPAGIMIGPVLGGFIIEEVGWRTIFVVVALFTLISLVVVVWLVPAPPKAETRSKIDWVGAIALALTLAGVLFGGTTASVVPMGSPLNLAFWSVGILAFLGLIWNATHRSNPFIGLDVLRNRRFITPAVAVSLRMSVHDGVRFVTVLYLANVFSQSPKFIGFFMLFYALPLLIGVAYGGVLADRWPSRNVGMIGMFLMAVAMLWMSLVNPEASSVILAPGLIVAGLSAGISLAPFNKTAVAALGQARIGLAAGLYNTIRFVGVAAATPLLGLLLAAGFARHGGIETVSGPYQLGFGVLAGVAVLGIGMAALIPVGDQPRIGIETGLQPVAVNEGIRDQ